MNDTETEQLLSVARKYYVQAETMTSSPAHSAT